LPLRWICAAFWCCVLLLTACAGSDRKDEERYDNARALASQLHRPVDGTAEERTYRNGAYRGRAFSGVWVQEPRVEAPALEDREYQEFLEQFREDLVATTLQALAGQPRFGPVAGPEGGPGGAAVVCRTEALVHVTPTGYPVGRDPVFRDPRPKLFAVYTLEDASTGATIFKFTGQGISHWEYGPWAMEDLRVQLLKIAQEFGVALTEEE